MGGLLFRILGFKAADPVSGGDFEAPVFQTFRNGDGVAFIDFAGAGAALDGHGGTGAEQGNLFGFQREHTVVFQQNHAFTGSLVGNEQIVFFPLIGLWGAACFG